MFPSRISSGIFLPLLFIAMILSACNPAPVGVRSIPLPPQATVEALEGAYEVRVDDAAVTIRQKLTEAGFGKPTQYNYAIIRDGSTWDPILAYYTTTLESSWAADPRITGQGANFHYAGWRRGSQALIVNYVEWMPDFSILVLMLTEN